MAKPKRFTAQEFIQQLDDIIETLIVDRNDKIEVNPRDIQIQEIAQAFTVNTATLRRWCQEHAGLCPREYLSQYRIKQAKQFLSLGMKPSVVSQKMAFTDHKIFSSVFKRITFNTPSQFNRDIAFVTLNES